MKEKDIPDLIDDFLLGYTQTPDMARLENLRKINPDIDLQVIQSIEAFRVLQYARNQQLRQKLRQIDIRDNQTSGGSWFNVLHITLIFVIIFFVSLWIWSVQYFSPASLAIKYFESASPFFLRQCGFGNEDVRKWEMAYEAFIERDFQSSIQLLKPFLQNPENRIFQYAQWNTLLARLGNEGPCLPLMEDLRQYESESPEHIRKKVSGLIQMIDSPIYQILIVRISPQLSALKPRLM